MKTIIISFLLVFTQVTYSQNTGMQRSNSNEIYNNFNKNDFIQFDTLPCQPYPPHYKYTGKGSGTKEDPYQITNINEFQEMGNDWAGDHYWILMNDIDASETKNWNPFVNSKGETVYYMGFQAFGSEIRSLDGRGHVIRNLFTVHSFIFGNTNCLTLKRIGFENIYFDNRGYGTGLFTNVFDIDFRIEESYITGRMKGNSQPSPISKGFGEIRNNTVVRNCYTNLEIEDSNGVCNFTYTYFTEPQVTNCYAAGSAVSPKVLYPFGYYGNVTSCFWDNETIHVSNDSVGLGLGISTADMKKRATFESVGWDFENVWYIDEGMDYPKLKVFRDGTSVEAPKLPKQSENRIDASPNPANAITTIRYALSSDTKVYIGISDLLGVEAAVAADIPLQLSGEYTITFDTSDLPSGIYFLTLKTDAGVITKQFAVVK